MRHCLPLPELHTLQAERVPEDAHLPAAWTLLGTPEGSLFSKPDPTAKKPSSPGVICMASCSSQQVSESHNCNTDGTEVSFLARILQ